MSEFVTPNGKTISTFIQPNSALVAVKFNQGGELPAELSGLFTSVKGAETAIKHYLKRQEQKQPKKG